MPDIPSENVQNNLILVFYHKALGIAIENSYLVLKFFRKSWRYCSHTKRGCRQRQHPKNQIILHPEFKKRGFRPTTEASNSINSEFRIPNSEFKKEAPAQRQKPPTQLIPNSEFRILNTLCPKESSSPPSCRSKRRRLYEAHRRPRLHRRAYIWR